MRSINYSCGTNTVSHNPEYNAIIHKLNNLRINTENIFYTCNKKISTDEFNIFLENVDEIIIDKIKDIRVKSIVSVTNTDDKEKINMRTYELILSSSKMTTNELISILDQWIDEYKTFSQNIIHKLGLMHFSINIIRTDKQIFWTMRKFSSCKTFDNIFFPEKDHLLDVIDNFIKSETYNKEKGIPHNLGCILHGKPGCGKTSIIKALANHLKRHIVQINLSQITTCGQFESILFDDNLQLYKIPINERILVLEDIDAMTDIVIDRDHTNDDIIKINIENDIDREKTIREITTVVDASRSKSKNYIQTDKLNLSYILNALDGINEQSGRIIIITSNYVEKLDKALTRPGRFDIKIELGNCTNLTIHQMINHYSGCQIDDSIEFKDNYYSPAEVMNICTINGYNVDKIIETLIK